VTEVITGHCERCGRRFPGPWATRSNKRWCSNACKQAAWRDDRVARAREVLPWLAPGYSGKITGAAGVHLRDEILAGGERWAGELNAKINGKAPWTARVEQLKERRRDLYEIFGPAVLAASAMPLSSNCCRFCVAVEDARVHGTRGPRFDAADAVLLGRRTCGGKCLNAQMASLTASVYPAGAPAVVASAAPPVAFSAAGRLDARPVRHHQNCATCKAGLAALEAKSKYGITFDQLLDGLIDKAAGKHPQRTGTRGQVATIDRDPKFKWRLRWEKATR
jgi:hypothetical protein